jgi:hypothetical protein
MTGLGVIVVGWFVSLGGGVVNFPTAPDSIFPADADAAW